MTKGRTDVLPVISVEPTVIVSQGEETCTRVVHERVRFLLQCLGHEGVGQLLQRHQNLPQPTSGGTPINPPKCSHNPADNLLGNDGGHGVP